MQTTKIIKFLMLGQKGKQCAPNNQHKIGLLHQQKPYSEWNKQRKFVLKLATKKIIAGIVFEALPPKAL